MLIKKRDQIYNLLILKNIIEKILYSNTTITNISLRIEYLYKYII